MIILLSSTTIIYIGIFILELGSEKIIGGLQNDTIKLNILIQSNEMALIFD